MSTATSHRKSKAVPEPVHVDPVVSAKTAGLRYVSDDSPGISRRPKGKGFAYLGVDGKVLRNVEDLARIKSLVIPPAWTEVWICPRADGHLQATGRDARHRKQYRYHPRWRSVRDETKYSRLMEFGKALPSIRKKVEADLQLSGLPRDKVLATVVRLLELTLIRVGNEEYARTNGSFGLTTMQDRHLRPKQGVLTFAFKGKSGVKHAIELADKRLAKIVQKCRDLPGHTLFRYLDDEGQTHSIDSADVNSYLHDVSGRDFTAKDFRTWAGTVLAAIALQEFESFDSATQAKKNVIHAIESVAERLGNTPTVCRKCYVHPEIIESYLDGSMAAMLQKKAEDELADHLASLRPEEAAVLALLHARLIKL